MEPSGTEGNSKACADADPVSDHRALRPAFRLGLVREAGRAQGFGETSGTEVVIEALMRVRTMVVLALLPFGCSREPTKIAAAPEPSHSASSVPVAAAPPSIGDVAPPIVATASNGQKIDLAAMKGKHVVVYFYPKDDTPGCTKEACAFRDAWAKLEKASIVVIGVSQDDDASHKAFTEKHKLPFPLVADKDGAIGQRYGVSEIKPGFYSRVSYLVGPDGKLKKIYPKVDPGLHADEILADAQ